MAIREFGSFEAFRAAAEAENRMVFVPYGTFPEEDQVRFAFAISRDDEIVGHFSRADGPISIQDSILADNGEEYLSWEG